MKKKLLILYQTGSLKKHTVSILIFDLHFPCLILLIFNILMKWQNDSSVKEIYNLRNYVNVFAIETTLYPDFFLFSFLWRKVQHRFCYCIDYKILIEIPTFFFYSFLVEFPPGPSVFLQ